MTAEQVIPPIIDPRGKCWQQPHRRFIEVDDKCAFSFGEPKMVQSKTPKNYNDNRKGITKGLEFCSAVPLWQAQKWLREKRGYVISVHPEGEFLKTEITYRFTGWNYSIIRISKIGIMAPGPIDNVLMSKYEQALSEGIKSALELIEEKGE